MTKFYTFVLLTGFYFVSAQEIKEIFISQNGLKTVISFQIHNTAISMDTDGNLLKMNVLNAEDFPIGNNTAITFENDGEINYQDPKSIAATDSVLEYYDDFYSHKSGKVRSVNKVPIDYYDSFYPYQTGKLSSVGSVKLEYYDGFHNYEKGKIKSIGKIQFTYNDNFYPYKTGKFKSIKGNKNGTKITVFND